MFVRRQQASSEGAGRGGRGGRWRARVGVRGGRGRLRAGLASLWWSRLSCVACKDLGTGNFLHREQLSAKAPGAKGLLRNKQLAGQAGAE